ncbi:MAG: GTPase HflX [Lachnospiraceae bacterium]
MFEIKEEVERLILVGVATDAYENVAQNLDELEELVKTAGGETVAKVIQNLKAPISATYIGKGKIEEIRQMAYDLNAVGIVCDDELSPAQLRNLEDALQLKVMDRTLVILDIFAAHASTSEGKIQVELAQLRYRATRLVGLRNSLSRLGGGIGTRGPGEKKLEMDRRLIHQRIGQLKGELEQVKKNREIQRQQRVRSHSVVAAIVGYTNAGKSTLLNTLTGANVLEEDKLFATLDPTTRQLVLDSGDSLLLTDTVGFIQKLPHHLIDAFRSTLEEAKYADIILHVVDTSDEAMDLHMHVVYDTLRQLGVENKTFITVFNKMDQCPDIPLPRDFQADYSIAVSAKTGMGLDELKALLEEYLRSQKIYLERIFSYQQAGMIQLIRSQGQLLSEEYTEEGIVVKAFVPAELMERLSRPV